MEKIEIKYDKKKILPIIVFLSSCVIAATYFVFFTDKFADNEKVKYLLIPANGVALYFVYIFMIKFLNNNPVIKLTSNSIEINEKGKPIEFPWTEIKDIKIEKKDSGKGGLETLSIVSDNKKGELNLGHLDKGADEIMNLINGYRLKDR